MRALQEKLQPRAQEPEQLDGGCLVATIPTLCYPEFDESVTHHLVTAPLPATAVLFLSRWAGFITP